MDSRMWLLALILVAAARAFAAGSESDAVAQFRRNHIVEALLVGKNGIPTSMRGELAPPSVAGGPYEAAISFLEQHKLMFGITDPKFQFELSEQVIGQHGVSHIRLSQRHRGLEVVTGELNLHFSGDLALRSIGANVVLDLPSDIEPVIGESTCARIVIADLKTAPAVCDLSSPQLCVFPTEHEAALCWKIDARKKAGAEAWQYFVSARDGSVVARRTLIQN